MRRMNGPQAEFPAGPTRRVSSRGFRSPSSSFRPASPSTTSPETPRPPTSRFTSRRPWRSSATARGGGIPSILRSPRLSPDSRSRACRSAPPTTRSARPPARRASFASSTRTTTPAETILFRARLPFVALLAALLLAVRAEARRRWGAWAGCAALAFAALEPTLNAHAGVVHTDVAVTLFVVLSLGPLARLARPEARGAAPLLGLLWGLAFLSKFSAPLLALCTLPFLAADATPTRADLPRLARRLAAAAGIALPRHPRRLLHGRTGTSRPRTATPSPSTGSR